nr:23S rRNA (pseudouridine(1915)-N(3))-methyltransferase RlmH [Tissierella praeacuta]
MLIGNVYILKPLSWTLSRSNPKLLRFSITKIPQSSFVIALVIEGKQLSSKELSIRMKELMINGTNDISTSINETYIVGTGI